MPNRAAGARQDPPLETPQLAADLLAAYTSSTATCVIDSEYRFLWVNHGFAALSGLTASEHIGKTLREVLGPVAEQIEPYLHDALASGRRTLNVELSATRQATGSQLHWKLHFFPIQHQSAKARVGVVINELPEAHNLNREVQKLDGRLQREIDRFHTLSEINDLLASNWDVALLFPHISARIRRVLQQEMAAFVLYDGKNDSLVRQALDFPLSKGLLEQSSSGGNSPEKQALETCLPLIFSRNQLQTFDSPVARSLLAEGLLSLCCVPMTRPKGPLGVLVLGSTRPDAFATDDLALLTQVANQLALTIENHLAACEIELLKERLGEHRKYLEGDLVPQGNFAEIVGNSPALNQVLQQVVTVANSGATVLILGETGTGKELIARAIHRLSRRSVAPFIKVNCAAIPTGLLESELFGHEKGAFTGAVSQKIGRMELADAGTLFLDEVGEIPLELQPKLLRVLQDHEFERLGSNRTIHVDLRLIAATNRNLAERVNEHHFRNDLYYRLSVFPIMVPPLRHRKEDIPLLVRHFVRQFSRNMERHIDLVPPETMDALQNWHWPGNVRELENLMHRSVILSDGEVLRVPLSELRAESQTNIEAPHDQTLDQAERQHILRVLRETHGKLSGPEGAAKRLGLKRTTLQSKIQRLGITRQDYTNRTPD